jgi:hypothetical protein
MAEHQSVAAVFSPRTLIPSRNITPAPRKPMPETTCAATRGIALADHAGEGHEARRTQRDERVRSQARHFLLPLPFDADRRPRDERRGAQKL